MKWLHIFILFSSLLVSCSASRKAVKKEPVKPDYSQTFYWSALPFIKDSADLVVSNSGLKDQQATAKADVFFIHPTDNETGMNWNADVTDTTIRNKTDHLSCKFQASAFNECCRVYMPRYRDVKIVTYFFPDKKKQEIFDIAYGDIRDAFLYYLKHYNNGRPFIIAAHSQGSEHSIRLCKEFFDKDSVLNKRFIAAYIIGAGVHKDSYQVLKPCSDSLQNNCYVTFNATRPGLFTLLGKPVKDLVCVNPLTWTLTKDRASSELNKGGLPLSFKKIDPGVADAKIAWNGLLWVHKPKRSKKDYTWINKPNFHRLEYNLFYMNIRYNAKQRIDAYFRRQNPRENEK